MPWAKSSDTSAMHPVVVAPMAFVDWEPPRFSQTDLVNLLAGVFQRCAVQSAGYTTDYVISRGVLANTAGDNWQHWAALMERAGYLIPIVLDGGEPAWRLIDDPENLVHIRLRDELEWERQRRADNGNPQLVVPVRLRDGDGCRYCGCIVVWGAQKGGRGGTYDHRSPGQKAMSPDDLRVSCRACNSRRKDHPDADDWCRPLPAPVKPHYGAKTVDLLAEHGHHVRISKTPRSGTRPNTATSTAPRPGDQPDPAPRDLAASWTPPVPAPRTDRDPAPSRTPQPATRPTAGHRGHTNRPRPGPQPAPAPRHGTPNDSTTDQHKHQDQQRLANPSNRLAAGLDYPGRDGIGTGAQASTPTTTNRNRTRRGRRGRTPPPPPRPHPQPPNPPQEHEEPHA